VTATVPRADDLAACLADEVRLYGELLELGGRERDAVVGRDPAELNAIVAEKERVVAAVNRAELARQRWIALWSSSTGNATEGLTLSELLRTLPSTEAAAVLPLRDQLMQRLRDVAQMNHDNSNLVQSALRIVSGSIEMLARVREGAGYQSSGARVQGAKTIVLDYRA
jgi:hypothetical protein